MTSTMHPRAGTASGAPVTTLDIRNPETHQGRAAPANGSPSPS